MYLSRFNDYSFILPSKIYSVVVRYVDNNNRIKELSFPNYFVSKEKMAEFLDNFNIAEAEKPEYIQFERLKVFKKISKFVIFILFAGLILGMFFIKG